MNEIYFSDPVLEYIFKTIKENPELIKALEHLSEMTIEGNEDEYLESWK